MIRVKEIVERVTRRVREDFNIEITEFMLMTDRVCFKLPDDLTRREVEVIAHAIGDALGIAVKPFGTPYRRGFHVKL